MKKIILFILSVMLSLSVDCVFALETAPDFTLTDIDGIDFSLSDYRGTVVLLDFFATWCGPCVREIPRLRLLNEEFGEDLVIISISVSSDTVEDLQRFREEHEMNWIVARDTTGLNVDYDVQYIPTLVVVDQEGYMRHRHVGFTDESVLRKEIVEIVPEFPKWTSTLLVLVAFTIAVAIERRLLRKRSNFSF